MHRSVPSVRFIALALLLTTAAGTNRAEVRAIPADAVNATGWPETLSLRRTSPTGRFLAIFDPDRPLGLLVREASGAPDQADQTYRLIGKSPAAEPALWPTRARFIAFDPPPLSELSAWPAEARPVASLEAVGPGETRAWLAVPPGTPPTLATWWQLAGRQPVARFDVLLQQGALRYCRVTKLADVTPLDPTWPVQAWPTPYERLTGGRHSRVTRRTGELVEIAAVPELPGASGLHVDFTRGSVFVGQGTIERSGRLFWTVRILQEEMTDTAAAANAERPEGARTTGIAIGDRAVIRTPADSAGSAFAARLFAVEETGLLLNAGARDGVRLGEQRQAFRDGQAIATVEVVRVQQSYARLNVISETPPPQPGDRIAREPPGDPTPRGTLTAVTDSGLFAFRLLHPSRPGEMLSLRDANGELGLALVLWRADGQGGGWCLPDTLQRPPTVGTAVFAPTFATAVEE